MRLAFDVLADGVAGGLVPGAVAAVGTAEETLRRATYGWAQVTPRTLPLDALGDTSLSPDVAPSRSRGSENAIGPPWDTNRRHDPDVAQPRGVAANALGPPWDTNRRLGGEPLFDLASLTKVVVTTTLCLRYLEQGGLFLDQRVASVLPAFGAFGKGHVTVRQLLTHTSGLPAWKDLRPPPGGDGAGLCPLDLALREPLERAPGAAVVYSDLGFIALGALLAEIGGAPLDVLARREVLVPLGMGGARYRPGAIEQGRCVPTEVVPKRGGLIVGDVHDDNAAAMGGVSGHAGLFAGCQDLERFCRLWLGLGRLDGQRFLASATVHAATRDQTDGLSAPALDGSTAPASHRGLGWVLQPNPFWVPCDLCSPRAYSHTGFTGTSLLIDPDLGIFAVLLTNRVHPTREGGSAAGVRELRGRFHNAVWAALST